MLRARRSLLISLLIREFASFLNFTPHGIMGLIQAHRNGLNMRPEPFKCRITPRSPEIRETIIREGEEAEQRLQQYDGETKYRMSQYYAK